MVLALGEFADPKPGKRRDWKIVELSFKLRTHVPISLLWLADETLLKCMRPDCSQEGLKFVDKIPKRFA